MKRFLFPGLILMMCLTFLTSPYADALESRELTRELMIQEAQQDLFRQERKPHERIVQQTYDVEKDIILNQLEVITGDEENRYIVVVGDTLVVSFDDRGRTNTALYQVSGEGKINLPLIGATKVGGLTRAQVREILSDLLSQYIRKPNVCVRANTTGRVMILGAVRYPGIYPLQRRLTTLEAILMAGSYNPRTAKLNSIVVLRGAVDKPVVMRLDLKKMVRKGDRSDNVFIKPGDLVYVPTTFISNLEAFLNNIYKGVSIWYGLGGQDIIEEGDPFLGPIE